MHDNRMCMIIGSATILLNLPLFVVKINFEILLIFFRNWYPAIIGSKALSLIYSERASVHLKTSLSMY